MSEARHELVGQFVEACIGDPDEARRLLTADPTLLGATWAGDPLLHWFVIEDFAAAATFVLDAGFAVDLRDQHGMTALHHACVLRRLELVRILLDRGADVNADEERIWGNPLHIAVQQGFLDGAVLLLERGARVDYLLPGDATVFGAMQHLGADARPMFVAELTRRGITREGLFVQLGLSRFYDSPEQAFGW